MGRTKMSKVIFDMGARNPRSDCWGKEMVYRPLTLEPVRYAEWWWPKVIITNIKEDGMNELTDYSRHEILTDNDFGDLIARRSLVYTEKKAAETELKDINEQISGLMAMLDNKAVLCEGWKITLATGLKKTLNRDLLISAGVSVEQIVEATVETPYTRLTVTEVT